MIVVILIAIVALGVAIWYNRQSPADKSEALNAKTIDESPQPIKCGCGRSPSGICVGLHKLSKEEWDLQNSPTEPVIKAKTSRKSKIEKLEDIAKDEAEVKIKKPRAPRKSKNIDSTQS